VTNRRCNSEKLLGGNIQILEVRKCSDFRVRANA
jgi:hypothetical protein